MTRIVVLAVVLGVVPALAGQEPSVAKKEPVRFEVASVKRNLSGSQGGSISMGNGRFTATDVTLESLIEIAYHLYDFQILNAPSWVGVERFNIIAKAGSDATPNPAQDRLMLQALLGERFGLVVHHETREMGIYNLVLARPDGKLGAGLRRADCAQRKCGNFHVNNTMLHADGITLDSFNETLSDITTRVVNQKTGLEGPFDIDLAWAREATDTSHPSIFTALQEQLGLKLEAARGPVEALIIDLVEQPTPD